MAKGQKRRFFQRLIDHGTGRLPPNTTLNRGRYAILDTIGRGGMGAVYQAQDIHARRIVAIKEMSQAHLKDAQELQRARQRFQDEAEMLKRLHHAHLPQVYDSFQENNRSYLVMEYIQGKSLFEILKEQNGSPLPIDRVLEYGVQLCDVLEYLHTQSPPIIFHDLKPSNVMVKDDGRIFLIDFGIARFFYKDRHNPHTEVFITPGYSSPEQYAGQTTPQSDLFSLGATLHHCLTGQNPQGHMQGHLYEFPPAELLNLQAPADLSKLLQELLHLQPQARPAHAREVARRLNNIGVPLAIPIVLIQDANASPNAPTVGPYASTVTGTVSAGRGVKETVWAFVNAGAGPLVQFANDLKQQQGGNIGQAMGTFMRQQVSQANILRMDGKVWERSFTFFWFVVLGLILGGGVYLLKTAPDAPHVLGLGLIVLTLGMFGFYLTGKHFTDPVPRSILGLMSMVLLLAGFALQAEPDMGTLIETFRQSATLSQMGAFVLVVGGIVCVLRPEGRLDWVEQVLVGFLALACAILTYGGGEAALLSLFPQLTGDVVHALTLSAAGVLCFLALLALLRTPKPLQHGFRVALLCVGLVFTLLQYTYGFRELQHFFAANDASPEMAQHLVMLSFLATWIPLVLALVAIFARQAWTNRAALFGLCVVEAMLLAYQGQHVQLHFLPGEPYPLATNILSATTVYQLLGPVLVIIACLAFFRLPRASFFQGLDHGALVAGAIICARLDEAYWQMQQAPVSMDMDQGALGQQFAILGGQLPAILIYCLLVALPLTLLIFAGLHLWGQSHVQAHVDQWPKRLRGIVIVVERLLVLAMVSIPLVLQGVAGTLHSVILYGANWLFESNPPNFPALFVLTVLGFEALLGIIVFFRLFGRNARDLGRSERLALLLAALSCLLLLGQNQAFAVLPLLQEPLTLTGNVLHWQASVLNLVLVVGLISAAWMANLWLRRSFFLRYRELLGLTFNLVTVCALLQFFWPILLPAGLLLLILGVLLVIRIEKVG